MPDAHAIAEQPHRLLQLRLHILRLLTSGERDGGCTFSEESAENGVVT
jgi:hypothetical protein